MVTIIPGPVDSTSTTISIEDIVRVKAHTLACPGMNFYSLYVYVAKAAGEHFYLFSYKQLSDMELAYKQLNALIKSNNSKENAVQIVPFEGAMPVLRDTAV
ncbi:hypothetical protein [Pontibacter liquoris]|uniref:hypothetical protein n=1 Tax=Pontibacter liquoris TaxID=2905677 RepID=UPI001FA6C226|nr:hypothetical protein [Pontibacter liquoris]